MFVVMASNVYWEWTPNKYLAGLIAVGAAYGATQLVTWCSEKRRQQSTE